MKAICKLLILANVFLLYSCEREFLSELFGNDKVYKLSNDYKIILDNKDTLKFESSKNQEVFIVDSIINGFYFVSITGTCGKKPFDIFEFQYIYISKIADKVDYYVSDTLIDCDGRPFNNENYITYIKGLVDIYAGDGIIVDSKINWYGSLFVEVSDYSNYYNVKKIRNYTFDKVYEFNLNNDNKEDSITTWYYTDKYGFVGYIKRTGEIYELRK